MKISILKLNSILRPIRNRWHIILRYAQSSPTMRGQHRWLFLGALKARMFGQFSYLRDSEKRWKRNFWLPIGRRNEGVFVDLTSASELDTLQEILVEKVYPLDRIGFDPALILDCGANIGYFSSLARTRFPAAKLVCWEPNEHNFSRLRAQPLLRSDKVECFCAAVSCSDGSAMMIGSGAGGTIEHEDGTGPLVTTIDLPRWISEHARGPLLLKMDIEGHESRLLPAMRGHWVNPCALLLETHREDGDDGDLIKELETEGFAIEHLRSHSLGNDRRTFKEYLCRRS
jgi:FkbM family methyltransferase